MKAISFLSCFSGIEAASVALMPLGYECLGVAEIDKSAAALLAIHFPNVPNLGDVSADDFLDRVAMIAPEVLIGGPPCQDFSVAGLRAGIHGARGNLTLRWVQIIHAAHARVSVTENVPGWLSANDGHAFGAFLAGLVGHDTELLPPHNCGGRWTDAGMVDGPKGRACWRILDAQFFGLAQRRRRVFVVFCPRDGIDPSEILFERKGMRGDHSPSREARERVAFDARDGVAFNGQNIGIVDIHDVASTLDTGGSHFNRGIHIADTQTGIAFGISRDAIDRSGEGAARNAAERSGLGIVKEKSPIIKAKGPNAVAFQSKASSTQSMNPSEIAPTMDVSKAGGMCIAFDARQSDIHGELTGTMRARGGSADIPAVAFDMRGRDGGAQFEGPHDTANIRAANGGSSRSYVAQQWAVRRLTPRECERLQGFPDDYTLVCNENGKGQADEPRYRQLGNSMAVPVIAWIGERIIAEMSRSDKALA